jgi:succinoglycan biosynthesis protein ExoL
MQITILLPAVSQVRYWKYITALERLGVQPDVLAFERSHYPRTSLPGSYQSLGRLQHQSYHKRFLPFVRALPRLRAAAEKSDAIFTFGLDTLLLAWLATRGLGKKPKLIYEVGDIQEILLGSGLLSRTLRWLERYLVRSVYLLVATSQAYVTEYYQGIQGVTDLRYQVIENKIDAASFPETRSLATDSKWDGTLRIGYFGLIRCRRSWEILRKVAERGEGRIRVHLQGILFQLDDLEEEVQKAAYVRYAGPYVSPDDLPAMYAQVDMVWACYPYEGTGLGNWRWARTFRFYDSCFFKKPMFVQAGSQDGRVVETSGLGACLDLGDIEGAVERILGISEKELTRWRQNISHLPKDMYVYSEEHKQLLEAIR